MGVGIVPGMPHPMIDQVDWPTVLDESLELFRALLRFDTTNPPGNEMQAAQWLHALFEREGIESPSP